MSRQSSSIHITTSKQIACTLLAILTPSSTSHHITATNLHLHTQPHPSPSLHYSITPSLHYSITPLLHHSISSPTPAHLPPLPLPLYLPSNPHTLNLHISTHLSNPKTGSILTTFLAPDLASTCDINSTRKLTCIQPNKYTQS
jgi:hypothetical protein